MTHSNYIADHILRIEQQFKDNPKAQLDSLWRIASAANLFQDMDNELTEEQQTQTWKFINKFKVSSEGEKALKELEDSSKWGFDND